MLHKQTLCKISAAICVLLLTVALAVGVAQARYSNEASWTGCYTPSVQKITSDMLTPEGQTVVLQSIEAVPGTVHTESIQLLSSKGYTYATMECSADSEYLVASLDQSGLYIVEEGSAVQLKLTVTEQARQLTQITRTKVSVQMRYEDGTAEMKADYQVTLIPEGMNLPSEETGELEANLSVLTNQEDLSFAWQEKLAFTLIAENNTDSIQLRYNGDVFPKGTRYTVGGARYILGEAMAIQVPAVPGAPIDMTLDFSQTNTTANQIVNITALAHLSNQITGQISFSASATRVPLSIGQMDTDPIINGNGGMEVPISGDREGLTILVQHLKKTDSGTAYVPSEDFSTQIRSTQENADRYLLEISNKAGKAPAGTYRLSLMRMCGEQIVSTCQMTFFVHY